MKSWHLSAISSQAQLFFSNVWGWFFMHCKWLYITGKVQICQNDNRTSLTAHSWDPAINLYYRTQTPFSFNAIGTVLIKNSTAILTAFVTQKPEKTGHSKSLIIKMWRHWTQPMSGSFGNAKHLPKIPSGVLPSTIKPRWCKHLGPREMYSPWTSWSNSNFEILAKHYVKKNHVKFLNHPNQLRITKSYEGDFSWFWAEVDFSWLST